MRQVRQQNGAIEYIPDEAEAVVLEETKGKADADYTDAEVRSLTLQLARLAGLIK